MRGLRRIKSFFLGAAQGRSIPDFYIEILHYDTSVLRDGPGLTVKAWQSKENYMIIKDSFYCCAIIAVFF
jgi:hypothetical protein